MAALFLLVWCWFDLCWRDDFAKPAHGATQQYQSQPVFDILFIFIIRKAEYAAFINIKKEEKINSFLKKIGKKFTFVALGNKVRILHIRSIFLKEKRSHGYKIKFFWISRKINIHKNKSSNFPQ